MVYSDDLDYQISELVTLACSYPPRSLERQRYLTKLIRLIIASGRLWRESTPYYEDALQRTFMYLCQNICEVTTARSAYDPEQATVITWINNYLSYRLRDFRHQNYEDSQMRVQSVNGLSEAIENIPDPFNSNEEEIEDSRILEEFREWLENDPSQQLINTHVRGRPDINAQTIITRRFLTEQSWQDLSDEFQISISTLSAFFQRRCLPILRNFRE